MLTQQQKDRLRTLCETGESISIYSIAKQVGCSVSTAWRYINDRSFWDEPSEQQEEPVRKIKSKYRSISDLPQLDVLNYPDCNPYARIEKNLAEQEKETEQTTAVAAQSQKIKEDRARETERLRQSDVKEKAIIEREKNIAEKEERIKMDATVSRLRDGIASAATQQKLIQNQIAFNKEQDARKREADEKFSLLMLEREKSINQNFTEGMKPRMQSVSNPGPLHEQSIQTNIEIPQGIEVLNLNHYEETRVKELLKAKFSVKNIKQIIREGRLSMSERVDKKLHPARFENEE
jgi:hypothetical protein